MDTAGNHAAILLEHLQLARERLHQVWSQLSTLGLRPGRPYQTLSGRTFTVYEGESSRVFRGCIALGLTATGADAKEYDLSVSIWWDDAAWVVTSGLDVEADNGGQTSLREVADAISLIFGDRRETSWFVCLV